MALTDRPINWPEVVAGGVFSVVISCLFVALAEAASERIPLWIAVVAVGVAIAVPPIVRAAAAAVASRRRQRAELAASLSRIREAVDQVDERVARVESAVSATARSRRRRGSRRRDAA